MCAVSNYFIYLFVFKGCHIPCIVQYITFRVMCVDIYGLCILIHRPYSVKCTFHVLLELLLERHDVCFQYFDNSNNATANILLPSGRYLEIELQGHRVRKFIFNCTSKFLPKVGKSIYSSSKNNLGMNLFSTLLLTLFITRLFF